jgi:PAS domain S-box-containing protein
MSNNYNYLQKISVLYVEDNSSTKKETVFFLRSKVAALHLANDADEGVELFKAHSPDIIVVDIDLPKFSSIEMAGAIHEINEDIPIVVLTSALDAEYLTQAIDIGLSNFLLKPLKIERLFEMLDKCAKTIFMEQENQEMKQVLQEYRSIAHEKEIISKTDLKGNITYVNEPFLQISGYSKKELIGKNHNIIKHEDANEEYIEDLWKTIKEDKEIWRGRFKNKNKQGVEYYVDSTIKPILDDNGEVKEFIAICHDITSLVLSKQDLKKQNLLQTSSLNKALSYLEQYENGINESNIFSRTDTKGNITYVNEKFIEISGYSKEELLGSSHNIVRHPEMDSSIYKELWQTIESGQLWKGVLKNKSKQDDFYYIDAVIVPIFDSKNNIIEYMGICHDITAMVMHNDEMEHAQQEIISRMGEICEIRSQETANHVRRVAEYSKLLATLYGLDKEQVDTLYMASPMHDIGKVGISDAILNKPGKLSHEERNIMQEHCEIGHNILKGSKREVLQAASIIAYSHHEWWDGTGYPQGLKEEAIPIFGRITAVADVFDAWSTERVYKEAWDMDKVFSFFQEQKGKHFDPKLVDLFFENIDAFLKIRDDYMD